jgi:hypothetical protein
MSEKEIERFDALDEEGELYTVVRLQRLDFRRDVNGNLMAIPGVARYRLLSGEDVNSLQALSKSSKQEKS